MLLQQVFPVTRICVDLAGADKAGVFGELAELLVQDASCPVARDQVVAALNQRELRMSTGIMPGIAVPHGQIDGLCGTFGCVGISRKGLDYGSLDGGPVYLVFMLVSPLHDPESHVRVLANLAMVMECPGFMDALRQAPDASGVVELLGRFEDMLLPLGRR